MENIPTEESVVPAVLDTSKTALNTAVSTALKSKDPSVKIAAKIVSCDTPLEFIENSGIDLLKLYENLNRIALNSRLVVKDRDGDVIDIGPNDKMQVVATTLILELAKHIKDKVSGDTNINFNLTVEQREEIRSRLTKVFGGRG